jgi:hypothetical protein
VWGKKHLSDWVQTRLEDLSLKWKEIDFCIATR